MIYWPIDYTFPFLFNPPGLAPLTWRTVTMPNHRGNYHEHNLYWELVYLLEYLDNAVSRG